MASKPHIPTLRLHKSSGQAVVTLRGKDYYLGPYGSIDSQAEYDRLIADYLARGRIAPHQVETASEPEEALTVSGLMVPYMEHVLAYYRHPDGKPTSQVELIKLALRVLRKLYGAMPASEFGPLALLACQAEFVNPAPG